LSLFLSALAFGSELTTSSGWSLTQQVSLALVGGRYAGQSAIS
jgi:hypothetical protein